MPRENKRQGEKNLKLMNQDRRIEKQEKNSNLFDKDKEKK